MAQQPIINPPVPNLPLGTELYERRYQDQFANVLRLYFNQISSSLNSLVAIVNLQNTVYKVADLPSAVTATAGARTFVSDSSVTTFNTTVAGGGANTVPVFSNGTNWKVG
jgi:hypothetical protein